MVIFPGKTRFLGAVLEKLEHYPGHPGYEVKFNFGKNFSADKRPLGNPT